MKVTWPLGDLHSKYCGTTQKSETTKVDIPSECVGKSGTPKSAGLIISVAIKTAVLGYIYMYIQHCQFSPKKHQKCWLVLYHIVFLRPNTLLRPTSLLGLVFI